MGTGLRRRLAVRVGVPLLLVALAATACGDDELSLTEYAEQVETLVVTMNNGLDQLDLLVDNRTPSLEDIAAYANGRISLRNEFLDGFTAIDPPERVATFHQTALDVLTRLTEAETEVAEIALTLDDPVDVDSIWDSDAGRRARAVDVEAVNICKAAQAQFDATEERAAAEGVPWIPEEMKEIVRVAFYCERTDRP